MSPLPRLVPALLSLVAWTAAAEPPSERALRARRAALTGAPIDVRVAPGIPTTLNFVADIDPRSVELAPQGHIQVLSVAARAITLTPVAALGTTVALRLRFAEACSALEPEFSLRTDAVEVDAQVTVYRDARAPDLLLAQMAELEARATACEGEMTALRERGAATGPAFLVVSGQLDAQGVQVAGADCTAVGLVCEDGKRLVANKWVVVSAWLQNPPGQPMWKPGGAWLVSESRRERIPARVVALESKALTPESAGMFAVEFARPPRRPGELYRVEVQEAEGSRHLSIRGVKVDEAKEPGEKGHGP
ncbi:MULTISPECIES: DUF2381 family protein [Myxococcus]|uniref:DUF2381 family protein n=1 Tax=Myxococcus TaxID=32 RepID=UPI0013D396C7|nr:DUF2381 family protein [Myxococcus eversor]NVJ28590.1 DUF2381 family protein [Myxococcus sp. AM011]